VGKASWSTTSACASVPGSSRVRRLTPDLPPYISYPLSSNYHNFLHKLRYLCTSIWYFSVLKVLQANFLGSHR
jgi:hypothetical protein